MNKLTTLTLVLFTLLITSCSYKEESSVNVNVNGKNVVDAKTTFDTDSDQVLKTEINTDEYRKMEFGHQKDKPVTWLIIMEDDNSKVLLSEKILDVKKYNEKEEKLDWDKSSLYEYLNSDFVNEYFTSEEKSQMIYTNDVDDDLATMLSINNLLDLFGTMNYLQDGYYGDKDFFAANDKIVAKPADLALYNEIDVFDNSVMAAVMRTEIDHRYDFANGCAGYWILNKPEDSVDAFFVTSTGYIGYAPVNTDYIGIRPIIRVKK